MINAVGVVTILVKDQDEALAFYTEKLGLEKFHDFEMSEFGQPGRWLTVRPATRPDMHIFLAPMSPEQADAVSKHPMITFYTDDIKSDYAAMSARGVAFQQEPVEHPWGWEVVFADPFGNSFSLMQPSAAASAMME